MTWKKLILSRTHAYDCWSEEALKEVKKLQTAENDADISIENKCAQEGIFTIDNQETTDYDDAVSIVQNEQGWLVSMYITDVASYLNFNGKTISGDRRAGCFSLYTG